MTWAENVGEMAGGRDFAEGLSTERTESVEGTDLDRSARRETKGAAREASAPPRDIIRIRFGKDGALRFISHNSLLRLWDRLFRRTGLPVRMSQGFHPHLVVSSPLALPLGVVGAEEIIQIELEESIPVEEIERRIVAEADPGLRIVRVDRLASKGSLQPRALEYRCELPESVDREALRSAIARLLAMDSCVLVRRTPGKPNRNLDLRASIEAMDLVDDALWIRLRALASGTARPEEVLTAVGLEGLLAGGARLIRSKLELEGDA